jgi:hypothetical protein
MKLGPIGLPRFSQSVVLVAICCTAILAFLLVVILPAQRLSAEIDRDIIALKSRLEEQRVLAPLFTSLFAKAKAPTVSELPRPAKSKLNRQEMADVPRVLRELAAAHRLSVREITPDVNSLTTASGRFLVHLAASGQFLDLRGFLLALGGLSYLDTIQEIEVRTAEGGVEEIALKIWLARE